MTLASERFFEKYNKLPKDVQRAMFSSLTSDRIFEIGSKHSLAIDKMGLLSGEIGWGLLGEKRASQFVENLQKALGLNHEKAYEIAQDVNHSIFYEIRENLKKLHGVPVTEALIPEKSVGIPTSRAGAVSVAATPQMTPGLTAPAMRVAATPSAPVASSVQPKPIAAQKENSMSGAEYWRKLDEIKKEVPSLKAETSLSNGVNHEIEENKKGSLAQIEQKEEERALGVRMKPAPQPSRLASQNLLENEVGAILGSGAPAKPAEKSTAGAEEIKPATPKAGENQKRPAMPPVPPPNLPTIPAPPLPKPPTAPQDVKTMPATPPAQKNNFGAPSREPGNDPYREPIE